MKFLLLLILIGCNNGPVNIPEPEKIPEVVTLPTEPTQTPNPGHIGEGSTYSENPKPFPSATGFFTAKITALNCSKEQMVKFSRSEEFISKLLNSQEFKDAVLGFKYGGKNQFFGNEGLSNEAIYNHLVKGAEALIPSENYQMDITAQCYLSKFSSSIGYTYPSSINIYVNMKYHASYKWYQVAGNTAHEWVHKMGFDHSQNWTKDRDYSVPYGIGYLVSSMGKQYDEGKILLTPLVNNLLGANGK